MTQITARALRQADWKKVYQYTGATTSFSTYACDALPGLTVTHEKRGSKRTRTYYTVRGRQTDSPTQAVRLYNTVVKNEKLDTNSPR